MDDVKVKVTDDAVKVKVNDADEPFEEFDGVEFNRAGVGNFVTQVGRLYFNVLTLPVNLLPRRSRYHAKNSIREGFLSFKALVEEVTEGIDRSLNRSLERDKANLDADEIK